MRVRHKCAEGMLVRAERAERTMADFVGVANEEGEIDYWPRGRYLCWIGFDKRARYERCVTKKNNCRTE